MACNVQVCIDTTTGQIWMELSNLMENVGHDGKMIEMMDFDGLDGNTDKEQQGVMDMMEFVVKYGF